MNDDNSGNVDLAKLFGIDPSMLNQPKSQEEDDLNQLTDEMRNLALDLGAVLAKAIDNFINENKLDKYMALSAVVPAVGELVCITGSILNTELPHFYPLYESIIYTNLDKGLGKKKEK